MGIYTYYNRSSGGSIVSTTPGSKGTLRSSRQTPPFVNAPYKSVRVFNSPVGSRHSGYMSADGHVVAALSGDPRIYGLYGSIDAKTLETARGRLNNRLVKGRAALGIAAATADQTFAMLAKRASTIRNAYKALRTGNVKKLERTLGLKRSVDGTFKDLRFSKRKLPPHIVKHFNAQAYKAAKRKRVAKWERPEDVWLEYTFGWSPLVADIYEVIKVKSDPFEVERCFGTFTLTDVGNTKSPDKGHVVLYKKTKTICTAGLKITNPNTALLTQLGLTNPLLVAWDVIPFSFVVDWFLPVSTYLKRYNDMAGFSYVDPVTTVIKEVIGTSTSPSHPYSIAAARGRSRERMIGIVNRPVRPQFRIPTPGLWLAATSTALLVQVFRR